MARRPKRSLVEELTRHRDIVSGAQVTCSSLAALYHDVPEFAMAARLLKDGHDELERRAKGADEKQPALALVESEA